MVNYLSFLQDTNSIPQANNAMPKNLKAFIFFNFSYYYVYFYLCFCFLIKNVAKIHLLFDTTNKKSLILFNISYFKNSIIFLMALPL